MKDKNEKKQIQRKIRKMKKEQRKQKITLQYYYLLVHIYTVDHRNPYTHFLLRDINIFEALYREYFSTIISDGKTTLSIYILCCNYSTVHSSTLYGMNL